MSKVETDTISLEHPFSHVQVAYFGEAENIVGETEVVPEILGINQAMDVCRECVLYDADMDDLDAACDGLLGEMMTRALGAFRGENGEANFTLNALCLVLFKIRHAGI